MISRQENEDRNPDLGVRTTLSVMAEVMAEVDQIQRFPRELERTAVAIN